MKRVEILALLAAAPLAASMPKIPGPQRPDVVYSAIATDVRQITVDILGKTLTYTYPLSHTAEQVAKALADSIKGAMRVRAWADGAVVHVDA